MILLPSIFDGKAQHMAVHCGACTTSAKMDTWLFIGCSIVSAGAKTTLKDLRVQLICILNMPNDDKKIIIFGHLED